MNLSPDIILKTKRCKLRIIRREDIPFIFSATRYEGFNDGMLWDAPDTEAELIESYKNGLNSWRNNESYSFTICRILDDEPMGRIVISSKSDQVWTIGFWLHPEKQEKGYMTESAEEILKLGFETLSASRIEAYHALWNVKSERVLQRVGMNFIEYIPQGFIKKGKWVEENKLAITREEWEKLKLKAKS
ncbi:MAG: GNAT family protein [Cyanobacteria bacterium P01_A01_bin.83]